MYTGSMFGKPAIVFAVWGYVIANMRPSRKDGQCYVELNAAVLAATFSTTIDEVNQALECLEAPDPGSRSKEAEGRRIVCLDDERQGPCQYQVVNGSHYRAIRDEEERRIYLREAKRQSRAKAKSTKSTNVNHGQPPSTQVEVEVENKDTKGSEPPRFAEFWATYPKRSGGNPRKAALKAYRGRLADGIPEENIVNGAARYRKFCDATGKTGTEYVKQAQYWLSPNFEGWSEGWATPDVPMSSIGVYDEDS